MELPVCERAKAIDFARWGNDTFLFLPNKRLSRLLVRHLLPYTPEEGVIRVEIGGERTFLGAKRRFSRIPDKKATPPTSPFCLGLEWRALGGLALADEAR